ncbi:Coq4 family protein [Citromicrobium bathyomarinum]|uniref:Coq4 family protein n=1 Tax=Citromicrobium bathyomarinum TaxID=72174 RepID=UPI00315A1B9B
MATSGNLQANTEQFAPVDDDARSFLLREVGGDEGGTLGANTIARHTRDGVEVFPIIHPERRRPKFDFAKALRHFSVIVKDKERTDHVFGYFDALPWRSVGETAAAFLATDKGQRIFQTEPFLPDIMDDHDTLRQMPKGSFAQAYCDFMEAEGLTAYGIVEEFNALRNDVVRLNDGVEWYNDRLRDVHDIIHVLTGYGRDTLGEQCLFVWQSHQRPCPGRLSISWIAMFLIKAKLRSKAPFFRAYLQARRDGRITQRLAEQPIRELLPLPLEEVRRRLNIPEPSKYLKVLEIWREEGVNPHILLGKQDAQASAS